MIEITRVNPKETPHICGSDCDHDTATKPIRPEYAVKIGKHTSYLCKACFKKLYMAVGMFHSVWK